MYITLGHTHTYLTAHFKATPTCINIPCTCRKLMFLYVSC